MQVKLTKSSGNLGVDLNHEPYLIAEKPEQPESLDLIHQTQLNFGPKIKQITYKRKFFNSIISKLIDTPWLTGLKNHKINKILLLH